MAKDHSGHKAMRTTQEHRQRAACEASGVRVRAKRGKRLVNAYDDVTTGGPGNGWKVHRKHQWRRIKAA